MKGKKQKEDHIPSTVEVLDQLVKPGTLLKYPEKPIIFKTSQQSAVKKLEVNICSMESIDMAVLHKLHTQTRTS